MIEIEKYLCKDSNEACKRERYYIEELKANLNQLMPARGKQEGDRLYYETHQDKIIEYRKVYREKNKDKMREYKRAYRKKNLEKAREKDKEYHQKNKEKHKEYARKTRQKKDLLYTCECGSTLKLKNKYPHNRTKKHLDYLKSL